ncbi:hypothetical protein PLICRDRAFT_35832 [Plicaturopsis crispa FD-325 SS-3]|nr:hypothetical protein PLICRDRAFT_35832 [Plicaturopsis crispa FD-325 SS-3]
MTVSAERQPCSLSAIPPEIILHIFSYLDLPDLAAVAQVSPILAALASDPILHRTRVRVVAPSRVNHALFALGPHGVALRPTVGDLAQRNVMRGLRIEWQWRRGKYFYSPQSVKQYEAGLRLQWKHTSIAVSSHLRKRLSHPNTSVSSNALHTLHQSHIFPDVESSSPGIARSLLPVMRQLKWSIQRDKLSKVVRDGGFVIGFGRWLESNGRSVVQESERTRLATCPGIRRKVGFFESLAR